MTALYETQAAPAVAVPSAGRARSLVRGRPDDPAWVRPSLLALLGATAVLYLWHLSDSAWGNSFYAAAAQAGSTSWKAFFFGSSDAANAITVDKPPASLWVMGLSARVFGFSSWSVLAPQALEGVAAVGLLYLTVRRTSTAAAGLIAGAVLATTPVAALIFRFDNPDALLVLLLVGAAYCVVRALPDGSTRWLLGAGTCVGFAFLTKQLQAFLVLPPLAAVYLYAAPVPLRRRVTGLLLGGVAVVLSAGWWIAAVALTPASARPYIGGSTDNSILSLTFGYNGFGRLTGDETGSVGGGGFGGGGFGGGGGWGATGWLRMFNAEFGSTASYLLPGALVLLAVALWVGRRAPRTDLARAGLLLWGGWLLVTGITFSLAKGIIHPYYTVALAPAIGGLVGIGAVQVWRARRSLVARFGLAAALAVTVLWTVRLLDRAAGWHSWLRPTVVGLGVAAVLALLLGVDLPRRLGTALVAVGLVAAFAAPAVASVATASVPHSGALPSVEPVVRGAGPFGGRLPPGGFAGAFPGRAGTVPGGAVPGGAGPGGAGPGGAGRGGLGGLLDAGTTPPALVAALRKDASSYTWVAAAVGSNSAAGPQLASGKPVMALGGFNGTDPSPTLAQFQALVAKGEIHYFLGGGSGRGGFGGAAASGTPSTSSQITSWVTANFTATTIGGTTVYDLTSG